MSPAPGRTHDLRLSDREVDALRCAIVAFSTAMQVAAPADADIRPMMDEVVKHLDAIKSRLPEEP